MNFLEKIAASTKFSMLQFLGVLTLIQFWWIAIWGLAYIGIDWVAGGSKFKQILIYVGFLLAVVLIFQFQPRLIEKL